MDKGSSSTSLTSKQTILTQEQAAEEEAEGLRHLSLAL